MKAFECGSNIIIAHSRSIANRIRAKKDLPEVVGRELKGSIRWREGDGPEERESPIESFAEGTIIQDIS